MAAGRLVVGQRRAAARGRGRPEQPLGWGGVVGSAAVADLPKPTQNPGTAHERAKRARAQAQHRAHTQGRKPKLPRATAQRSAQPWGLFPTAPPVVQAAAAYAQRMPRAEPVRDWHSGWGVRAAEASSGGGNGP